MRLFLKTIGVLFEKMIGIDEKAREADMHLPGRMLGMALASLLAVFLLIGRYIFVKEIMYLILAAGFLFIFIGITLCYRNQRIYILSEEEFQYSTFLGNKKVYRFDQIKALRKNHDSLTLFVADGKVHIESSAVLSDRLKAKIINSFKENEESENQNDQV